MSMSASAMSQIGIADVLRAPSERFDTFVYCQNEQLEMYEFWMH